MKELFGTIFAPSTAVGAGAVNVVRLSGEMTFGIVDKVVRFRHGRASDAASWSAHFGEVLDTDGELLDQVVVVLYKGPDSYTGEDCAEISCHASSYIVSRLMELLSEAGARLAEGGEFTRRAYLNGKMDLSQAEAVADVIAASSSAAHRIAVNQLRGGYSGKMRKLRDSLLDISALVELELDFSEEDVEFADRSKLRTLLKNSLGEVVSLRDSFKVGNALKSGVPVAIVGEPNSGKSTLLNALLGEDRAIVSPVAGTTRDTVEETFHYGGVLYRLIDTAGLRETADQVERMGVERTMNTIGKAEIVIGVVDVTLDDAAARMQSLEMLCTDGQHFIPVWNKTDMIGSADGCGCGGDDGGCDCGGGGDDGGCGDDGCGDGGCDGCDDGVGCGDDVGCGGGGCDGNGAGVLISAKNGEIAPVLEALDACGYSRYSENTLVTSERHFEALNTAAKALSKALSALDTSIPTDLLAEDLRNAVTSFNEILGDGIIDTESILGRVFERFCIGK